MKLSARSRVLMLSLLALAVLAAGWWFWVKPASDDLSARRSEVAAAEAQSAALRSTLAGLRRDEAALAARTAEGLRMAKAIPTRPEVPAALVQISRLAERANVEFSALQSAGVGSAGGLRTSELTLEVKGAFFDVDDFLYRLHRQVQVDDGRPGISGRLFAVTGVQITPAAAAATAPITPGSSLNPSDEVAATVSVVVFSGSGSASSLTSVGAPQ
jgi:hypothetical protein